MYTYITQVIHTQVNFTGSLLRVHGNCGWDAVPEKDTPHKYIQKEILISLNELLQKISS